MPGPAAGASPRRRATQTSAPARSAAATGNRLTGPIRGARSAVTAGPTSAPALPPAAMKPNSRRACSSRQTSAMKLQNTDTTKRLKTLSQMKKAAGAQAGAPTPRSSAKSPRMQAMKNAYTTGRSVRRGKRAASKPKRGTAATMATKVPVKSHGSRSTPVATPISSRTGRST